MNGIYLMFIICVATDAFYEILRGVMNNEIK